MVKTIKCINHELVLCIPTNDEEHIEYVSQITKLLTHLSENPKCKFVEAI